MYFHAFSLDRLGHAERLAGTQRLARIRGLALPALHPTDALSISGWLEAAVRVTRLGLRFGSVPGATGVGATVNSLRCGDGYGQTPNLWDTYLSLHLLTLLGELRDGAQARRFVDALQVPSIGFALPPESRRGNLDVIYAGVMCCTMLGLPLRYPADMLAFVLACQAAHGGFSRAPTALPDIARTRRALQMLEVLGGPGAGPVEPEGPRGTGCLAR